MRTAFKKYIELILDIDRAIGMNFFAQIFPAEHEFVDGRGCTLDTILFENIKCTPKGIGFESHDYFSAGTGGNSCKQCQIAPELIFINNIIWGRDVFFFHDFVSR